MNNHIPIYLANMVEYDYRATDVVEQLIRYKIYIKNKQFQFLRIVQNKSYYQNANQLIFKDAFKVKKLYKINRKKNYFF